MAGNEYGWSAREKVGGVVALAAVVGLGFLAVGKNDREVLLREDRQAAMAKYKELYQSQDPEGRFLTQYVNEIHATGIEPTGGRGLIDLFSLRDMNRRVFQINNACFRNTAYDTGGGYIEGSFSGFFSSGRLEDRTPTAVAIAHVSRDNPNVLEIRAGNDSAETLSFGGAIEGEQLEPLDATTEDALATHGCRTGILDSTIEYDAQDRIL